MNKTQHDEIITDRINSLVDSFLPNGAGPMNEIRFRIALNQVAQVAFREGRAYGLMNLLSADDVAEQLGVSKRRAQAIIIDRHERFGIGAKMGRDWFVHIDELEQLRPGPSGRPKGKVTL